MTRTTKALRLAAGAMLLVGAARSRALAADAEAAVPEPVPVETAVAPDAKAPAAVPAASANETKPPAEQTANRTTPQAEQPAIASGTNPPAEQPATANGTTPPAEQPAIASGTPPPVEQPPIASGTTPPVEQPSTANSTTPPAEPPAVASGTTPPAEQPAIASGTTPPVEQPAVASGTTPPAEPPSTTGGTKPPEADAESPPTTVPGPSVPEAHDKLVTNVPTILTTVGSPAKKQWEADHGGFLASRFAIANRLSGRPGRLVVRGDSLPKDREDFLWRVARDTWAGLTAYTDRENGLVVDNVRVVGDLVPPLALQVGDYTNITNIGLQLVSFAAARRIGLIDDIRARDGVTRVLDTLATMKRFDGYFFNYYDTTSLEPTSSFLSFVDTAWLVAGLMVTRQAFPDLAHPVDELLEPIDLHWFYDDATGLMSHGYYVARGQLSAFEYGAFYTEARLGSLIAIGKGDAPESHWWAMKRASQPACLVGECPELHQLAYRLPNGRPMKVRHYRWRSHEYVPSWGGSMFEALMPRLVLDEGRFASRSLGPNGQAHALLQKIYATEALGFPVWGMSPCIEPETGRYHEYGVKALGNHGYDETVVTPHAAALALAVAPDDAAEDLMELARRYPIYGPFGFYDSVAPSTGKVAYDQLALDQLMLFLAVANHLSGNEIPALFAEDPWVRDALPLLAEERFFQ